MNLRQIEVFRAIMLCRSVTDAARMLGVSQPTLTKVLRRAEDQLGFRLFRREHGRLQPSEEAQLLFSDADRIFRELQSLQRLSTDLREGTGGLLRVGATASLALSVVPDALTLYRREFPGVRIMSYLLAGHEIAEMVMAHQLDVGVSIAPFDMPAARTETIHHAEVICIMPEGHPLTALGVVTPHEIGDYPLISYSGATRVGQMLEGAFRRVGMRRRVDIEVSLSPLACVLVQRGAGIALVDGFIPRLALPGIVCRKFRPQTMQQVNLVTPLTPSHFADKFVAHLRQVVTAVPALAEATRTVPNA
ncbi:MAG TPA: LysR family transcriptional regulator [Stellaceae bacterium]|nr:LysR family transcriptional regulator [Stellaceae bacterium]